MLSELSALLANADTSYSKSLASNIIQKFTNPRFRRAIQDLMVAWQEDSTFNWGSRELAAALAGSAHTAQAIQQKLAVELAWTGPDDSSLPIRRTDQVLLQLIRECRQELTLISFAIYKVPVIAQALIDALDRGVTVRFIAETPESGDGKIPFGLQSAFGSSIITRSEVLIWPKEKRPVDLAGRYGSLHIKGAIADGDKLFITSANLTEYAMSLNMELGVLIQSAELAQQINDQLKNLLLQEILVPL